MSQAGIINVIESNPTIPIYFEGDTGIAIALFNTITIFADQANNNSGESVSIVGSGAQLKLNLSNANGDTFLGNGAGAAITNGRNTAVGQGSMQLAGASALVNTAIGTGSLRNNNGEFNTAAGYNAGLNLNGSNNTTLGAQCGENALSLTNSVGLGWMALQSANGAVSCTAIGVSCLLNCASANMIGLGQSAFQNAVSSTESIGIGILAGFGETNGSYSVLIGHIAGRFTDGANYNVIIGHQAGTGYTTNESNNIIIGAEVLGTAGDNNWIRIGNQGSGTGQQSNCAIAGIFGSTVTGSAVLCDSNGVLGTVVSSERYKDNIISISEEISIMNLEPRQFNYKKDESQSIQYGLIAEEVEKVMPYLCVYGKDNQLESVKYHELPTLLLMEIQRLNKRIQALESKAA